MHVFIHKFQWIHRRQGTKVPKKIVILPDKGRSSFGLFTTIIYLRLDVFTESAKVYNTQHMRLVAIGYEYVMLP